jgi:hypothetical protein
MPEMVQRDEQRREQSSHMRPDGMPVGTPFPKGMSGKQLQRARLEAEARQLAQDLGGYDALPAADRALVLRAARVSLSRPKTDKGERLAADSLRAILGDLERRARIRQPAHPFARGAS